MVESENIDENETMSDSKDNTTSPTATTSTATTDANSENDSNITTNISQSEPSGKPINSEQFKAAMKPTKSWTSLYMEGTAVIFLADLPT